MSASISKTYSRGYVEYVFGFHAYSGTVLMPERKYSDKTMSQIFSKILGKVVCKQFAKDRLEVCGAITLRNQSDRETFAVISDGFQITAINVPSIQTADEVIDSILERIGDAIDQDTEGN